MRRMERNRRDRREGLRFLLSDLSDEDGMTIQ